MVDRGALNVKGSDMVICDTCSMLENEAFAAFADMGRYREGNRLHIPCAVFRELDFLYRSRDSQCREQARAAMDMVSELLVCGAADFIGDRRLVEQADRSILKLTAQLRFDSPVLVITQDRQLAADIAAMGRLSSAAIYPVRAMKLDGRGALRQFDGAEQSRAAQRGGMPPPVRGDAQNALSRFGIHAR